jgi:predicted alpha-1,6-mannanase (GH76 family)
MTALTRLSQLTGTSDYSATAANARTAFYDYFNPNIPPQDRYSPAYYDDECWWGSCFLDLYALTGDNQWVVSANQIFLDLQAGWDNVAKGGVWWKRNPKSYSGNSKCSVENELYMDIAMGLYNASGSAGQQTYLAATQQAWQWLGNLIDSSSLVWGNLKQDGTIDTHNVPRPYTQGALLNALWNLYQIDGDTTYLDSAQQIAQAAIQNMTWPDGILQEVCEKLGNCGPNNQDPCLFKGIYVRYLGEFTSRLATVSDPARVQVAQQFATFLQLNADRLWANYPGGIFGMDWHTPAPNYQPSGVMVYDGSLQTQAVDLFVSAALVSA